MNFDIITVLIYFVIIIAISILAFYLTQSVYKTVKNIYYQVKFDAKYKKEISKKKEELRKKKENGFVHEWIRVPILNKEYHVCKKTGWCPSEELFVPMNYVDFVVKRQELVKNFQDYHDNEVKRIANYYNIDEGVFSKAVEEVQDSPIKFREEFASEYGDQVWESVLGDFNE